jgi:trk system potassium uptake protein
MRLLFEAVSAFGTVGLSTGITPELSPAGRVLVVATMFVGRLGPLTLALALAARERRVLYRWPEEAVKIG